MRRRRELRPLSSEHQQALLVAFQLRKSLAGQAESAGAPKELPGLVSLARRYEVNVFRPHTRAEEDLLGGCLAEAELRRLAGEHAELTRLLAIAKGADGTATRSALAAFAELLERHVRWEDRELFPAAERRLDDAALASIEGELEKRLVLARTEAETRRTAPNRA
ncbi:MAG TPA: hemerythrin domain-containing protein [Anaeromyxobacteraceae bacterium]|nr:hemerythrin domain-containing protein [Anaeromyxobacteraceae bacterium]